MLAKLEILKRKRLGIAETLVGQMRAVLPCKNKLCLLRKTEIVHSKQVRIVSDLKTVTVGNAKTCSYIVTNIGMVEFVLYPLLRQDMLNIVECEHAPQPSRLIPTTSNNVLTIWRKGRAINGVSVTLEGH